ncbi:MAG: alpha/beta hydrolase [Rhodopirellula sp.]|nr:alpha/beta hydrolase [Rhodopirellula sp.]
MATCLIRGVLAAFIVFVANLLTNAEITFAEDPPEPVTSWTYPPNMPGSRIEIYKRVGDVSLNAYIFEPQGHVASDQRPAIVFFFGGGWRGGTPGQFLPQCQHLAKRGMVAISVDYRVKSRHDAWPQDCLEDAKSAVRWVRKNAKRLGVDPNRIAAGGGSAGGHLAAATALIKGFEAESEDTAISSVPNAMVLFNPAVALTQVDGLRLVPEDKLEDIKERTQGRPEEIAPINHVRKGMPPSIIFHGTADPTVLFASVEEFARRMTAAGNRCELVPYKDQIHGFFNAGRGQGEARAAANRNYHKTLAQMDAFLESLGYLNPQR